MKERSKGEALAVRARRAMQEGQHEEAQKLVRRALAEAPDEPGVLRTLAEMAASDGRLEEASKLLDRAIARHPTPLPSSWLVRLGDLRVEQGKLDEGVRAYEKALVVAPSDKAAWMGLATARDAQRNSRAAVEALQRAAALDPNAWQIENRLGEAWTELCEWERAEVSFERANRCDPDRPEVLVSRATLDLHRGHREEAIARFKASVAKHPTFGPGHAGLGAALRDEGRFEEAVVALERAKELSPDNLTYSLLLGRAHLEGGAADQASREARAVLARRPGHSGGLALEALARMALGDEEAVARFFDYATIVSATPLHVPSGFDDLAAFNQALAAHAAGHPTLMTAPASHATVKGRHSGSLLVEPRGPVAAFEQAIESAVAAYWRRLSRAIDLPFAVARPRDVVLAMWCVLLEQGAHQRPHIHPSAWLSGVYYPQVPEGIRSGKGPSGWLEFGQPDRDFPTKLAPALFRVRPEEGLIVLFPSYLYHRTLPFEEDGTRISVAFDVVSI